jgi:hypothetical protein
MRLLSQSKPQSMLNDFNPSSSLSSSSEPTPIFSQKVLERCHVLLPDTPRPTSAVFYDGYYYGYVKFFPTVEAARRAADRLINRGNKVILTRVPKGLVLWVLEPEAQLVAKPELGQ